jgi:putative copper export protein/mono/diheme cytochrome c family protein
VLPAFDIDGGLWLASARAVSVAALLSVLGCLTFRVFVAARVVDRMPPATAHRTRRHLILITRLSAMTGLLAMLVWLALQAADMASARSGGQALAAVPAVLLHTDFGHVLLLQLAALAGTAAVLGRTDHRLRQRIALALAAVALALQAGHSHAASMVGGPSLLLAADVVHLLAAGAWIGGLLPLLLLVHDAPPKTGALAARWFSPLGKCCVVALAVTALFQGWVLVASIPGLVGTAYGWMVGVKLALFGVLFAFALANRYWLAPALLPDHLAAKRPLVCSIAVQTGFGLAIIAAAAVLSSLAPAMHEQAIWPFPDRFTLDTLGEDPDFRNEVLGALAALGAAAILLVIAALLRRRLRWLAIVAAAVIAWFAIPHLDLLFVPAYPTSFYQSPTRFAATAIVQGAALYPGHCASCHGAAGRGDGPAARGLPVPPADLTAAHLWMHSDGELFWWLTHGIEAPEDGMAMPGFATVLSEDERWDLIDFIRAHNAGLTFRDTGAWTPPLQAPELQAQCTGDRTVTLADLRGGFVRLVIGPVAVQAVPGVTTILASPTAQPADGVCVAGDEGLPHAYAIVSGQAADQLAGTQFLLDGAGWLRAMQRPTSAADWNDTARLLAQIHALAAHPIADSTGGSHAPMQM